MAILEGEPSAQIGEGLTTYASCVTIISVSQLDLIASLATETTGGVTFWPKNGLRSDLRVPVFKNFPGGACPQTLKAYWIARRLSLLAFPTTPLIFSAMRFNVDESTSTTSQPIRIASLPVHLQLAVIMGKHLATNWCHCVLISAPPNEFMRSGFRTASVLGSSYTKARNSTDVGISHAVKYMA